jgi:hypothetical protein
VNQIIYDKDYYQMIVDLWNKPMTAEAIAMLLGKTKGSVIGVVHRARLRGYKVDRHSTFTRTKNTYDPEISTERPLVPITLGIVNEKPPKLRLVKTVEPKVTERISGVHLLDLASDGCKYPVESDGDKHLFCNKAQDIKGSYCKEHSELVYTATKPRIGYANWGKQYARR